MILHNSLRHGIPYHFKVHKKKLFGLTKEFPQIQFFLKDMITNCPDKQFLSGPRSSALKFPIEVNVKEIEHPIKSLAAAGLSIGGFDSAHSNVQMFILHHDFNTIAIEVPIWTDNHELGEGSLSGHIDILRIEDGKIWVWDYKPNAHREKFATTQTYYYAKMLSERSGIALENFMCGWFDDKKAYVFEPKKNS